MAERMKWRIRKINGAWILSRGPQAWRVHKTHDDAIQAMDLINAAYRSFPLCG